ncbi:MAG: hypothetical protein NTX25_17640, partial [Proteobacteria bacterium]|nr:hypothetical protein [Pseudomonadota bacterium]
MHNTQDCLRDTANALEEARSGIIPSDKPRAYFEEGEARTITQTGKHQGIILVQERVSPNDRLKDWFKFQSKTEGVLVDADGNPLAYSYRFENASGRNFKRMGDGRAHMPDGSPSNTTIDAKSWTKWSDVKTNKATQLDVIEQFTGWAEVLRQNPGRTHVIEFKNAQTALDIAKFLKSSRNKDWFSENIFIAVRKENYKLADDLVGFSKKTTSNGRVLINIVATTKQKILVSAASGKDPLRDIVNIYRDFELKNQDVFMEGGRVGVEMISLTDIAQLLPAAHQYWLNQGALASVLNSVEITIGQLPSAIAGQTQGSQIVLSEDGAGWGWFVDATPNASEEFS